MHSQMKNNFLIQQIIVNFRVIYSYFYAFSWSSCTCTLQYY